MNFMEQCHPIDWHVCKTCKGKKKNPKKRTEKCPTCAGTGKTAIYSEKDRKLMASGVMF